MGTRDGNKVKGEIVVGNKPAAFFETVLNGLKKDLGQVAETANKKKQELGSQSQKYRLRHGELKLSVDA